MSEADALVPMIKILLVEDNPGDTLLASEVFKEAKVVNDVYCIEDGNSALAFLRREGKYTQAARPDLILLDLFLPGKDGHEILIEIKKNPEFSAIPVVFLLSSEAEKNLIQTFDVQPDCTMIKPIDLEQFIATVVSIEDFGLLFVKGFKPLR